MVQLGKFLQSATWCVKYEQFVLFQNGLFLVKEISKSRAKLSPPVTRLYPQSCRLLFDAGLLFTALKFPKLVTFYMCHITFGNKVLLSPIDSSLNIDSMWTLTALRLFVVQGLALTFLHLYVCMQSFTLFFFHYVASPLFRFSLSTVTYCTHS